MMGRAMTTRARQLAGIAGIVGALLLPKKTPCLAPYAACESIERDGWTCTPTDLEPLGIYALEWVLGDDVGVQYRRWLDCP
jgi:hypothetical protein